MRRLMKIKDWEDIDRCLRLGEIFVMAGRLSQSHLEVALDLQKTMKECYIGEILVKLRMISRDDLVAALKLQEEINPKCRI